MNRRLVGVVLVLAGLLLVCFARLAGDPSSLIVDADHPSLDHARPVDDPSVGNDFTRLFLPHHLAIARSIKKLGHLPLWDDRGFGGRPLLGNPQAGLFYPPTWIAWWSGAPSALGWLTVGHLLWAGIGTYRLSRTLGMGEWGGLVAAGCVQISPYVLAQTLEGHYPHVWSACWYPWAFDAAIRLRRGDSRAALWLAPILSAAFFTGHPQEGYYLLIALGAWAVFDGLAAIRSGQARLALKDWSVWAGILTLTFGLLGIELIPDMMAQEWSLKGSRLTLRLASRYHVYPVNMLQLLGPTALGGPADYFGHENYWESVLSIGLIPLVLAMIGVACSSDRRGVRGWLGLVVVSVVFAFGRNFGLFALIYEVLPGMERFRVPGRSLFLASLGASMLAGLGIEALRGQVLNWRRISRYSAAGTAILVMVVLIGRFLEERLEVASRPLDRITETDRFLLGLSRLSANPAFWLALGTMPVGLVLAWRLPRHRPTIAVTLGLLGLLELGYHGHSLIVTTPANRFLGPDPISDALREARPPGVEPLRIRAVDTLFDDLRAGQLGLTKTNVNDSFQIQHAAELYRPLYHLFDSHRSNRGAPMDQAVANYQLEICQSILDRMAVSLLIDDRLDPGAPWPRIASGTWGGSTFAVYRNPSAIPRAYVVPRAEIIPDEASCVARFREFDPRQSVLMPADPLGPDRAVRQSFKPADWASSDPDRVVISVTTEAPGLLVVADTWMPGWSAEVDGKTAPIFRGNRAQRVVPLLEAGRHEVILRYRTPGLNLGLGVTIASASVWGTWLVIPGIARRVRKTANL